MEELKQHGDIDRYVRKQRNIDLALIAGAIAISLLAFLIA